MEPMPRARGYYITRTAVRAVTLTALASAGMAAPWLAAAVAWAGITKAAGL